MIAPSIGTEHQFKVEIELSDQRILQSISPKINLT
jgi:hypothetical protein